MRLSAALAWIVAFSGCQHPVSPPTAPATRQSHWVLSADPEPDDASVWSRPWMTLAIAGRSPVYPW
jgi:hypothetical protein